MNDIPQDSAQYNKLLSTVQLRMLRSAAWLDERKQGWVRFYKLWRKIQDMVQDEDEPNIMLGYCFGLVEDIMSKVSEPVLKLRPPCNVLPMRFGDGERASNFKQIARNWYAKPNMQEPFCRSKKEMVITGTRWEIDEWSHIQVTGKMWGKVPKVVEVPVTKPDGSPNIDEKGNQVTSETTVMVDAEVERKIPLHYGFHTRYPSVFDMYPEPDRETIGTGAPTDCSWLIEDMGELAIEDMIRQVYVDNEDGKTKPLYDFSLLLKDAGRRAVERYDKIAKGAAEIDDKYGPLVIPNRPWDVKNDYGRENKNTLHPAEGYVDRQSSEDRDKVWVVRQYQANEIVTVANGKYIIQRKKLPWHVPIIPARVECYTIDPEFLHGHGVIAPVEDELYELNDTHNLSMANFIRIVNKMMAVQQGAIVSMNDFKPRAGGKIRIRGDIDVRQAIMSVDQQDPTPSMLNQESNTRGLIEFISANLDGSPGTMGTKQSHKTKGGLELIQFNRNTRFITIQRQALINEARRMLSMERLFSQFQFEKMPFRLYRDDGSTALAEFNKDDIFTEGRGFEFLIEIDPNFGDSQVQRDQDLFLFDRALGYEQARRELQDPTMRRANLDILFEKILRDFGWTDTSRLFTLTEQAQTPDIELQIVMQGGVTECKGDLMHHIETHLLQIGSPNLKKAIEAGKAHPDTIKNLQLMVEQAMARLTTFIRDPQGAAAAKAGRALARIPDAQG